MFKNSRIAFFAILTMMVCATVATTASAQPYVASSSIRQKLNGAYGTSNGRQYLLWNSTTSSLPQSRSYFVGIPLTPGVQCGESGQCVALVKSLCGAPATSQWRRGQAVLGNNIATGTAIATFGSDGRYDGGHAAIYRGSSGSNTILLWSQNWFNSFQCIARHSISSTSGSVSDPRRYYVIMR